METYRSNLENLPDYIAFFRLCLRLPKEPALADEAANWAAGLAAREAAGEPVSAMARLRACLSLNGCAWFCAGYAAGWLHHVQ